MNRAEFRSRAGGVLLLALLCGSLTACTSQTRQTVIPPTNATAAPAVDTATPQPPALALGTALKPGATGLTFKEALAKAQPAAQGWNATALLEVASMQTTPASPAAGTWNFNYITPRGTARALVAVSSADVQVLPLQGTFDAATARVIEQRAGLVDQLLDSPAIVDRLRAANVGLDGQDSIKISYYMDGNEIGPGIYANPLVRVGLYKGDATAQLLRDAITGAEVP